MRSAQAIVFLVLVVNSVMSFHNVRAQTQHEKFSRDSTKLLQELKEMLGQDQEVRSGSNKGNGAVLRAQSDDANTLRMISIINTYGFPSARRFHTKDKSFYPHVILLHAPRIYADTLKSLLVVEKKENRICDNEYAHIIWHLDGRVYAPAFQGVSSEDKKGKKRSVTFSGFCPPD